jgi:hypothetical protein
VGGGTSPENCTVPVTVPPFDTVVSSYAQAAIEPLRNTLRTIARQIEGITLQTYIVMFTIILKKIDGGA